MKDEARPRAVFVVYIFIELYGPGTIEGRLVLTVHKGRLSDLHRYQDFLPSGFPKPGFRGRLYRRSTPTFG